MMTSNFLVSMRLDKLRYLGAAEVRVKAPYAKRIHPVLLGDGEGLVDPNFDKLMKITQ
jgi:hypothetical protein